MNGRIALLLVGMAYLSLIAIAAHFFLFAPKPARADHSSLYLVCPDPVSEGNTTWMRVRRPGYKIEYAIFFTHHGNYSASPDDFEEYHGLKVESKSGENSLSVPIVTKEDTRPEHDETFAIGFKNDGVWHQCVITIADDDAPAVTGVEISTEPVDGYAYRAGEGIDVTVDFDSKVEVDGTPILSLYIGDGNDSVWRGAEYLTGSGSRHLVFRYRVQPHDRDDDGISVASASVGEDRRPTQGFSGNIYAEGTDVPINYAHSGVKGNWRQKVDGRPYVQSARITTSPGDGWNAYRANQTIEVTLTFDAVVVVEGDVTIDLHVGLEDGNYDEATKKATYMRGSGTDTLVFGYTVRPGDMDPRGVGIAAGMNLDNLKTGFGGSGTIKALGTEVERNPFYRGAGHQPEHQVDTEPPTISSVGITSTSAVGDAYDTGEVISARVSFSERVVASGDPWLELDIGGDARQATLSQEHSGTFGESLVFLYEVQEGDEDADGIGIGANQLRLNGGWIYDSAGNAANLSYDAVVADPDQKVNAAPRD